MPSDAKKAKAAAKKNANKKGGKKTLDDSVTENNADDSGKASPQSNGTSETGGLSRVSSHANRMAQLDEKLDALHLVEAINTDNRACTGVLASHPNCRD